MTFAEFKETIHSYMEHAEVNTRVFFEHDKDKRLFSARIPSEGLLITCPESGLSMTVKRNGHLFQLRLKGSGITPRVNAALA